MGVLANLLKDYDKAAGETSAKKLRTNILPLDYVTDGGIPLGRIIELYGENGTGKSTITMAIVSEFLRQSPRAVVYLDSELSFDNEWAHKNGIDVEKYIESGKLYILYPNSMDEAFEAAVASVRSGEVGLVVIDSLTALSPKELIEASPDEVASYSKVGTSAKKQTNFINAIIGILKKTETTMIVINQVRANISPYGAATTVPGSYALKHAVSLRLEVKRDEFYGGKENPVGIIAKVKCHKNKHGIPFRSERVIITGKDGLSVFDSNIDFMIEYGYIKRGGAMYTIEVDGISEKVKGRNTLPEFFRQHPDIYQKLLDRVVASGFKHAGDSDDRTLFDGTKQIED